MGPLLEKLKICKEVLNSTIECFDYTFDLKCLNALNVLVAVAQRHGDVNLTSKFVHLKITVIFIFYRSDLVAQSKKFLQRPKPNRSES